MSAPDAPQIARVAEWGVLAVCLAALAWGLAPHARRPLTWDEVDYVVAARRGVLANLVDQGTWSPPGFVGYVAAKARGQSGDDVADAHGYDEGRDLFRLRHMHPPVWLLPLAPALALASPEPAARWTQLAWTAVMGVLFLWVARLVAPERAALRAAALAVVLLDPLLRTSLLEMHAHVAFAAAFLVPLLAVLGGAGPLLLGAALGVLFATVTVGPAWSVLWLALLLPDQGVRRALGERGAWLRGAGAVLAALAVLWPGGLFRLGLVQEHAFRAYNLLFLKGEEWASAGGVVPDLLTRHPGLGLLALGAAAGYALGLRRKDTVLTAVSAATLAFVALNAPFLIIPRYALGGVGMGVLVILALGRGRVSPWARTGPWAGLALVPALALAGRGFPTLPQGADELFREEYAFVGARVAAGERVAAEGAHVYAFYGGGSGAPGITSVRVDYDGQRLIHRVATHWETFEPGPGERVVLLPRAEAEPPVFDLLAARCAREDRAVAVHFTCSGP